MKKVALVTDNSAYLTVEDQEKYGIVKLIPISFIVNGEEYYENVNMSYEQFYEYLADKKTDVSTSQPSIEMVKDGWREVLRDYDEIVYILLSSGLSAACNTALNASHEEEFKGKVFVVNNQRVSLLNKAAIIEANTMIKAGKSAREIKYYLEETKNDNGVYIAVDTLKFLKKGGRITPTAAAIGTLLNIKPILQIHGGKLDSYAKTMSMKQARLKVYSAIRREVEERFPEELKNGQVFLGIANSYPDQKDPELDVIRQEIRENLSDMPLFSDEPLPLFIVCHTGPNALGIGYVVQRTGALLNDLK
ncbi:MAG: DegV family protein [Clostridia bacterium]|nr:DegV family protein [Clostridia bacterium]